MRKLRAIGAANTRVLFLLFLVNALNIYDRQVLGAVLEPLRHQFQLSDAELGALPMVFTMVYALAGLPLGRAADRWSRRKLLAGGVAVWAGLTGLGGLAASYWFLMLTRAGTGIGEAVCAPVAASWIGDLVAPERRARAMAGFMMAVPVGVMLSFAISGPVAQAWGWRAAMAMAAVPAAVLVPAVLRVKEPDRRKRSEPPSPGPRPLPPGSQGALPRAFWWIAASGAVVNFILYSFSTFVSPFLTRFHGLTVGSAGVAAGVGSGVAGILGAAAAGAFGDRVIRKGSNGRLLLASAAALAAAPAAFAALEVPAGQTLAAVVLLMLAYGLLQMYYGLVYAAIQDIIPASLLGTAMAVYLLVTYVCGAAFGPLLTGGLSDYFARHGTAMGEAARAAGLHQAMYVIPVLCVALAAVLHAGARVAREG